jgi:selenocysteine lyase/cysteine desulfurase
LLVPEPIERVLISVKRRFAARRSPLVVISRMEHHSNDLPWRESIADVVMVGFDARGRISPSSSTSVLADPKYKGRPLKIGSFCAASNVTGIINDTTRSPRVMHAHGGYACFDYAAAAPYTATSTCTRGRRPRARKDAVFISVHKYLGGPQAPGLLVANKTPVPQPRPRRARRRHRRLHLAVGPPLHE